MPAAGASVRIETGAPRSEPVAERRRRAGAGGLVAAALLGGFVGAGLTAAAERYWPQRGDTTGPRIAQLEQRMAAVPTADVGAIERRLAAMETQQRETAQRAQAAQAAAERAAERADAAASRPADPSATPQPATAGLDPVALEKIDSRIAALEDRARTQAEGGSKAAEQLEARLAEQAKQVATLAPQIAEQGQRLGTIASQSAEQTQRLAALSQQVAQQNQRVEALAKQFAERGPEAAAALRVVAADRVANALRDGTPYSEAFGALARLKAEPQRLAAIEPFAKAGAPSAGALAQEFKPIAPKIIAEARGPANSWSDRIGRMAEGIVTIRPVGEPGSNTVPSLVARIDDALGPRRPRRGGGGVGCSARARPAGPGGFRPPAQGPGRGRGRRPGDLEPGFGGARRGDALGGASTACGAHSFSSASWRLPPSARSGSPTGPATSSSTGAATRPRPRSRSRRC